MVWVVLQSVGYQICDLLEVMKVDWFGLGEIVLCVDGGMIVLDYMMQFLLDIIDVFVDRFQVFEIMVFGVVWFVGYQVGVYFDQDIFVQNWVLDCMFEFVMDVDV